MLKHFIVGFAGLMLSRQTRCALWSMGSPLLVLTFRGLTVALSNGATPGIALQIRVS